MDHPHICNGTGLTPSHIRPATALTPSHICPATALTPSHICTGTGAPVDHICAGIDVQAAGISCKVVLGVDGIAWAADGCARDGNSQRCASGRAVVALEESLP